ncbi:MAG: hypothetical protein ACREX8_07825 [Gammaproteobacteria bacterium]
MMVRYLTILVLALSALGLTYCARTDPLIEIICRDDPDPFCQERLGRER